MSQSSQSTVQQVEELLTQAHSEGQMSSVSLQRLMRHDDMTRQINAAMGTPVDDVNAVELVTLGIVVDDSTSISKEGTDNTEDIVFGVNLVIDALKKAKNRDAVMAHIATLNGVVLTPFIVIENVKPMISGKTFAQKVRANDPTAVADFEACFEAYRAWQKQQTSNVGFIHTKDDLLDLFSGSPHRHSQQVLQLINDLSENWMIYVPFGGTPLYDKTAVMGATLIAKVQESVELGSTARGIMLVITDGQDVHSEVGVEMPSEIISGMLATKRYLVAAMGILKEEFNSFGPRQFRSFEGVFRAMSVEEKFILTPESTPKEIRDAFQTFSKSAINASQSGLGFSQATLGGFNN